MRAVSRQLGPSLLLMAYIASLVACRIDIVPLTVEWDPDPEALIVEIDTFGGPVPQPQALNHIPDARIWGDGRIVWVERQKDASRVVRQGQLSKQELTQLARFVVEEGFFDWHEHYQPDNPPPDMPTSHITVNLADQSQTVSQYFGGAPAGFWRIYDRIQTLVPDGEPLAPQRGWLRAWPHETDLPDDEMLPWPTDAGFTLSEATDAGRWIKAPILTLVWDALNRSGGYATTRAVFREGEKAYSLTVQVSGISLYEP